MAASSSSSSDSHNKYDVFLSFRGEDTRRNFVCHLHRALEQKAINAFIDSEKLEKGNKISELLDAIEDSRLSIVVLSENYASSSWCLKELVKILECMDTNNQKVVPIFYQVDPSHIRNLSGKFGEAFTNKFGGADNQELERGRSALARIADLCGWNSSNYPDDIKLIEEIVQDTLKKRIHIARHSSPANDLVGIDSHIKKIRFLLRRGVNDVGVVGIWGMGGIGKTTIAKAVYGEVAYQFEHKCFLGNVKEGFAKKGEAQMRGEFLSEMLKEKGQSVGFLNEGSNVLMEGLVKKKVLVVLDDVDNFTQIEALLGDPYSFGVGSRIIITTRDRQSLSGVVDELYEPNLLSHDKAHELFMKYAFRKNQPTREYNQLSRQAIEYAQGLPLALKVLGASLYNKTEREWKSALDKLKKIPHRGILDVLKTSIEGLDDSVKDTFLDVACFFRGKKAYIVKEVLDSCDFFADDALRILVDRALITISHFDCIDMHDLLQEMGREIVRKDPGGCSRLWSYEDVNRVLTQSTAMEAVECIILDLSNSKMDLCIDAGAFFRMRKLRLLMFYYSFDFIYHDYEYTCPSGSDGCKQHQKGDFEFLSHELRCLIWRGCPLNSLPSNFIPKNLVRLDMRGSHIQQLWEGVMLRLLVWHGCPLKSLPSNFQPLKLVYLSMPYSHIEHLWEGIKPLGNLKSINLSHSRYLRKIPDCSQATILETLDLSGCTSLLEVHPSISALKNLAFWSVKGCKQLQRLSSSIHLKSLKSFILSGCSKLDKFPEIGGIIMELPELCLDETGIEELPSSIEKFTGLVTLSLKDCRELKSLPISICQLKSLEYIILSGCSKFEVFPIIVEDMEELRELHLDGTSIKVLSPSIERLKRLIFLNMRNCRSLVCLPDNICNLSYLTGLTLSGCSNISNFPENCGNSESLLDLEVEGSGIKLLPSWSLSCDVTEEMTPRFRSWSSSSTNCLVGMVSHINQMELLLCLDQVDIVRFVGVCGMGGIGKTTIASAVYDKIACQFEYHCFLENVKEGFTKKGETQMQKEFLSRILMVKVHSVGTLNRGSNMKMENLGKKKVLFVLDDVDDIAQIETLLGQQYSFGGGSRIIVTTRDKQLLSGVNAMTYCPGLLRPKEALVLFRQFAFRTFDPTTEYLRLSRLVIEFAHGLPLVLKVLRAFLYYISIPAWEDALGKLKKSNHLGAQRVLRQSFDGLENSEKSIFLDVACFFKGMKRDYAITILESCGFFPHSGLRILIDRSLIIISHRDETLQMHDLLQDMGWEIICQESVEPGERSRLWSYDDVHHVLTSNTGTEAVEVITLDLSNFKEVYLNPEAFDKMKKLRLLQIHDNGSMDCKQHVNGDFKYLSHELRCLIWHRFPLKSLPSNFHPENLINLDMCFSSLGQLWEGTKPLTKLQFINLSHSPYLRKTSDMSEAPRLKKLILEGCTSLFEVHPSLSYHDTLVFLNLKGCRVLEIFPSPICMRSLRTLNLSGCSNFEKFPEIYGIMSELSEVDLDETAITELPSSIQRLLGLEVLSMRNCRSLVSLPDSICNLPYLQQLYLSGCTKLYNLPDNLRNAQSLTILEVQGSGIENKETVREGIIRVVEEGTSLELGVQMEEYSEGGGILRERQRERVSHQ